MCRKKEKKKENELGRNFNVDLNLKKKLLTGTVPKKNVEFKNFVLKRHTLSKNLELKIGDPVENVKPQEENCMKPTNDLFTRNVTEELSTRLPVEIRKNLENLEKEKVNLERKEKIVKNQKKKIVILKKLTQENTRKIKV